ncbi:MAG: FAD:protein FMN transferase [Pirellulales bacterium]|nr:FAD:protein FMN transferase [Pirellulales bacterium]
MPKRSTRRDFLRGKSVPAAPSETDGAAADAWNDREHCLLQVGRDAMACRFEIFLNAGQYPQNAEAAVEALDEVDRLEALLSVFRAESEISRVNRTAAAGPVEVESDLANLLRLAVRLHEETDGALDVTAGPLSDVWGFSRRQGRVPSESELADAMARVGTGHLEFEAQRGAVRFLRPGMKLNLGAIGKGYALDRAAEILAAAGVEHFIIHGGQSSVLARGNVGPPGEATGWTAGVPHPLFPRRRLARVRLCDRALGTSGSARQGFRHQGRRLGHVLDPRSGWPAEGLLSATVLAPTAAEADALATALFVLGPERAMQFADRHPDLAVLLVVPQTAHRIELVTAGFRPDEIKIEPPEEA